MAHPRTQRAANDLIGWIDLETEQVDFRAEVLAGLRETPKRIAAKFFYDERGSQLFEEITRLPEYYLTRTEIGILQRSAPEIVDAFGDDYALVELGSGSSTKVRILFDAKPAALYMPIDLSGDFLRDSSERLAEEHPNVDVIAVCGDYTRLDRLPERDVEGRTVVFFPGSTLGNLEPEEAIDFFSSISSLLQPGDGMLIGVDQRKDDAILHAAYNDAQGVTAEFNRNLLRRLNRDLHGTFSVDSYEHVAFYNQAAGRIEMHLRATKDEPVRVAGESFAIRAGEMIHTENSYKYDLASFEALLTASRFRVKATWSDEAGWFAVHFLQII